MVEEPEVVEDDELPRLNLGSMDWTGAACHLPGVDPQWFFPTHDIPHYQTIAMGVCHRCPIKAACLEFALENRIDFGTWGGESERARRRILSGEPLPPIPDEKRCRRCKETKPGTEFYRRNTDDGLTANCIDCSTEMALSRQIDDEVIVILPRQPGAGQRGRPRKPHDIDGVATCRICTKTKHAQEFALRPKAEGHRVKTTCRDCDAEKRALREEIAAREATTVYDTDNETTTPETGPLS